MYRKKELQQDLEELKRQYARVEGERDKYEEYFEREKRQNKSLRRDAESIVKSVADLAGFDLSAYKHNDRYVEYMLDLPLMLMDFKAISTEEYRAARMRKLKGES